MEREKHLILIYQQKESAPTSYYLTEGETGYLPGRVCINRNQFAQVKRGGYRLPSGQFKATFRKAEVSPYRNEIGTLHSNIYPLSKAVPGIIGTGDIKGSNALLVFEDRGEWKTIAIHIFPDCKYKVAEIISCFQEKTPT